MDHQDDYHDLFVLLVKRLDMFRSIIISSVGDVSEIRLEDTLKSQMRYMGEGFQMPVVNTLVIASSSYSVLIVSWEFLSLFYE